MTGRCIYLFLSLRFAFAAVPVFADDADGSKAASLFARENLVAWCIVPFDAKQRGPEARAEMLERLEIGRLAYDYRAHHIPTFDDEVAALKRHGIELTAWWFPTSLNDEARRILDVIKRHRVTPQLWVTGSGAATQSAEEQRARVAAEVERIRPIAEAAAALGCQVGLYNHGGWFGDPDNQLEILRVLDMPNVGIVYNLHHGHGDLDRFAPLLERMRPHLLALNLNGMVAGGDQKGNKILPLGVGDRDLAVLRTVRDSGYTGPIGILNHTSEDAEARLLDNLEGLEWLVEQLDGTSDRPRPPLRTWSDDPPDRELGYLLEGRPEFRTPPLTVECRVRLRERQGYNILVASDTKRSGAHWEIFSMPDSGWLTAYLPGMRPDHVRSQATLCDGRPHHVAMLYGRERVRLLVDGNVVADTAIEAIGKPVVAGGLGIGRLVEGGLYATGEIEWVRISRGIRELAGGFPASVERDADTLELWQGDDSGAATDVVATDVAAGVSPPYNSQRIQRLLAAAQEHGDAQRGVAVFTDAKVACLSCHRIGRHGGTVGPALDRVCPQRKPEQIVESLLWPRRHVEPEYVAHSIVTADGQLLSGYVRDDDAESLTLLDPATGNETRLAEEDVEDRYETGSLMPEGLVAAMTSQQQRDLVRLLLDLRNPDSLDVDALDVMLTHAHPKTPVEFEFDPAPRRPDLWPNWQHPVNRDRVYGYYAKQADYFRQQADMPMLLPEFPGLDGGDLGHWGNQDEDTWADDRWNAMDVGSVVSGVFRAGKLTVPRAVCVRVGDEGELAACFNPDTCQYEALWSAKDGFVTFSSVRSGFLHGVKPAGRLLPPPEQQGPTGEVTYRGFYRHGSRVVFVYEIDGVEYLDAPWVDAGNFSRVVAPRDAHPVAAMVDGGPSQWPDAIVTRGSVGTGGPYVVDTITPPVDNPWRSLMYFGGHDFLPDGSALVCTMQGDVWHVSGLDTKLENVRWRRFAAGLHHALGLIVDEDGIFVLGRDQITRLHDLNNDGEADFYESYSTAYETSPAGHDFICGLERDTAGNFYTASGNQGVIRISADGRRAEVIATGFRNPDGLGLLPDGTVTVPCSEGEWTCTSMVCAIRPTGNSDTTATNDDARRQQPPHYGYRGPRDGQPPELPLVYLPRGLDNSAGGQVAVTSDRWGPLEGQLVHLSFGMGTHFLLLRDEVRGQLQGAAVPLVGDFDSGVHRGRFHPVDGQLYVSGMTGWGSYTPEDGCFQRVRYTGPSVQLPVGFHVHENGVAVTFARALDPAIAGSSSRHFAQCWNYRYSPGYGSPEFSPRHRGTPGHDPLMISSAHVVADGRTLFLELPDLQPVNQLHLQMRVDAGEAVDLFVTVHALDTPFTEFPGYQPEEKIIAAHPILSDLALATLRKTNPWRRKIRGARPMTIEVAKNLSYATRVLHAKAGEPIALTLVNPDVVPHNWVLATPGSLRRVGELSNRLIADPAAVARHYVPETDEVLVYTDVVDPHSEFTIHFHAPAQAGRYPFLCTFPGHWMVMNGELVVEGP